jgi:hypothetical protein
MQQYIQRIGQQDGSHWKNIKYEFKIINAEFINLCVAREDMVLYPGNYGSFQ